MMLCRAFTLLLAICLAVPSLAQNEVKQRVKQAKSLADQGSAALPELQTMLQDPEYKVRLQAVKSIVKIGGQHSLDPLIEATRDLDEEIQIRAVNGMVNFYLPGYVDDSFTGSIKKIGTSIEAQFTDINDAVIPPDMEVRAEVIAAIGKIASGGSTMPSRANAARAVGILRGQAALPDLLEAAKSKNTEVIYESLIAMQKIRDKSAGPGITFLLRDLNDQVQIAALETTGLLHNHEALPQLYDVLNNARNKEVRRAALTAIAMLPDEKSRTHYSQYIADKDPLTRAAAAEGFARLDKSDDLPMLQSHFDSEQKMNPRLSLAFALVMLGQTDIGEFTPLQYLINALNMSSYNGVAQPFLVELAREPGVRDGIYQALPAATASEKIHLAQVLASSGTPDSVPHLETLSRDPDVEVATEGSRSLRILKARID